MSRITYKVENVLDPDEFREVLVRSSLGERRPIDNFNRLKKMCENANLIVTARDSGKLIGVARSISDFVYCAYLSDLAVDREFQNLGIGKKLIEETKRAAPEAKIILLSAPPAINYYPKIGMKQHAHCFILDDIAELK